MWINGNCSNCTFYCIKASKLCRRARRSSYSSTVKHFKECDPKKWWNNIKRLSGLSNKQQFTSIHHDRILMGRELTEHIAKLFCNVSKDVPPLNFPLSRWCQSPQKYIISPSDVYNALICINVHKAPGPDEVSNWLF